MSSISVGNTILRGYSFAARGALRNLGLTWLAAVFYAVAAGYWLHALCTTMLVSPHPGSELNDFALFDLFGLLVTTALGSAIIARVLTGAALEPGGEIMTAYFAVAKREWILFLSLLRLYVLVIVALFAVVVLGGLAVKMALPMIGANVQWQGITAQSAMNATVVLIAFAAVATLAVRLGFFAAPVASAENSMGMTRIWSLCSGNSWRVFAVAAALSVPALLLWAVAEWALVGNDLASALAAATPPNHNSTALYQLIDDNAAAIAGVWAALIVVLNMLFAGASAPAYLTVRDNISVREPYSVTRAPVLEPAFAGSFAGFAPRYAKEPAASDTGFAERTQSVPEILTAEAAPHSEMPVMVAEMPAEVPALAVESFAEPEAVQYPETADEQQPTDAHIEEAHEPAGLADEMREAPSPVVQDEAPSMAVAQFPLGADSASELSTEHVNATETNTADSEVTPLPSHGDETESSQQNAPSEAA